MWFGLYILLSALLLWFSFYHFAVWLVTKYRRFDDLVIGGIGLLFFLNYLSLSLETIHSIQRVASTLGFVFDFLLLIFLLFIFILTLKRDVFYKSIKQGFFNKKKQEKK
jgi:hypothetical protein